MRCGTCWTRGCEGGGGKVAELTARALPALVGRLQEVLLVLLNHCILDEVGIPGH
jgi:hypothetical protein